jgi:hypothetical protein
MSINEDQIQPTNESPRMFGPHLPHLPTEIILDIFTNGNFNPVSFFSYACVNKKWYAFFYETNSLRELMFLPLLNEKTGHMRASQHTRAGLMIRLDAPLKLHAEIYDNPYVKQADMQREPWHTAELNPFIYDCRTQKDKFGQTPIWNGRLVNTIVSYQLFTLFAQPKFNRPTASWRHMLITHPPVATLALQAVTNRCDPKVPYNDLDTTRSRYLQNLHGVTLGEVFDALWQTDLAWNTGLVANDGRCAGAWGYSSGRRWRCACYNQTEQKEIDWEYQKKTQAEIRKKMIRDYREERARAKRNASERWKRELRNLRS